MLGDIIKTLRKEKGLTQMQLGEIVGLAESTISLYENNKREPEYKVLIKLADFFEVSLDYLLNRELVANYDLSLIKQSHKNSLLAEDLEIIEAYKNLPEDKKKIIKYILQENNQSS